MRAEVAPALLEQLRQHWASQGWAAADLERYRMEDPPAGGDPAGGSGGDPPDLGDAGRRAIEAERARARDEAKARKEADKKAELLEAELNQLRDAGKNEQDKALDKVRKETEAQVKADVERAYNQRIVRSEVRVAAAGKLADPEDAVRFLDLDDFKVTGDGDVDTAAVVKAVDELLKDKPYLAAGKQDTKPGSIDQGARGGTPPPPEVKPGMDRLRSAYGTTSTNR